LDNRDAPAFAERGKDGELDFEEMVADMKAHVTKLQDGRLKVPAEMPHVEPHNTWVANQPGTLLVIPVADVSLHLILGLCYLVQNRFVLYDDINKRSIPGIEQFSHIIDPQNVYPLAFAEQLMLTEATAEMSASCYAGALMLQAMGLGGWMYDGINPFSILGASGDPAVPGLGFRYDTREDWSVPNVTGLEGVMEGFCPPHYPDMRAAVEAVVKRKFGPGGPFHSDTPGPWKDSKKVRSAAKVHDEDFIACVALQAQYIFDTFGKFPATVPTMAIVTFLQAHHLDLEFYDKFYNPGAYLKTHAEHMEKWHPHDQGE